MSIIIIALCAFAAYRANKKGYNPYIWFFTGGIVGLLVLAFLPFTTRKDLPHYKDIRMKRTGNVIGGVIAIISIMLTVIQTVQYYNAFSGMQ